MASKEAGRVRTSERWWRDGARILAPEGKGQREGAAAELAPGEVGRLAARENVPGLERVRRSE